MTRGPRRPTVLALGVVVALAAGCTTSAATRPAPATPSSPRATPTVTADSPSPRMSTASPRPTAVGFRVVTVVDDAAGTPARGSAPARRDRVLPTSVWYPAVGNGAAAPVRRPVPLVVFAHGFDVTPATYAPLLREIAAAGYVVAAPVFPISASGRPGAPREDDMANQALDVRAVVSAMLAAAAHGWLAGSVDPHAVAVVGHSDGAETVAGTVLVPADHDRRVGAAVILAGQLPTWGSLQPVAIPTLVMQGSADTINPPSYSRDLYRALVRPKAYLDVIGGTHLPAVVGSDRRARLVRRAVIAFLDATVRHRSAAAARLRRLGNQPGLTELTGDV